MKLRGYLTSILLLLLLSGGFAHSQTAGQNSIAIERAWSRATPAGAKNGAVYGTVINNGNLSDSLVGAATPVGDQVQFHSVAEENGVSRMREMPTVDFRPRAKVTFSPGGMHIMIVGLKEPLKEGQSFPMTMTFEKAGKIDVMIPVAKVGAMHGPAMDSMIHGVGEPMKK
ncbi:copper(I)-binding protein [Bradyrhizobium sp. AZCC 1578]|uniref:copper chaperone PCu(A)C n=1 Tax=Bradyrhizobium sp. AZCC 1578 TaxID=3117027 RepID=UPI002FF43807